MAIEASYNYPSDLNAAYPAASEDAGDTDDHLRGIKNVLKTTLPNVNGAITATQAELNLVDGSVAGTIVNSKAVVYGASGEVNATTLQVAGAAITSTPAELNVLDALAAGRIVLGNASNVPTATDITGDVTISNAGVTAIAAGVIVNADIKSDAAIDATKIANGTVTSAEFQYLGDVTGMIQAQFSAKIGFASTWNDITGTASTNGTAGQGYYNTGATSRTVVLPSSPNAGDFIACVTSSGDIVVSRNSMNINASAANIILNNAGDSIILTYTGDATVGWFVVAG
jgi:hypothetical protein